MSDENKRTKIKIFVKLFNDVKDRDPEKELAKKQAFVTKFVDRQYMPYALKMAEAKRIVENTTNVDVNGKQMFAASSPMRWVLYVMSIVSYYTSLEFDKDSMADYDLLDASGAIEVIFSAIGKDVDTFNTVLNMTMDDFMSNERNVVTFLENKFAAINEIIAAFDDDTIKKAIEDAVGSIE